MKTSTNPINNRKVNTQRHLLVDDGTIVAKRTIDSLTFVTIDGVNIIR